MRDVFNNCLRRTSPRNLLFSHPYRSILDVENRKTKPIDINWLLEKEFARAEKNQAEKSRSNSFISNFGRAMQEYNKGTEKVIRVKGLVFAGVCLMIIQPYLK